MSFNPIPLSERVYPGMDLSIVVEELVVEIENLREIIVMDETRRRGNPALQEAYDQFMIIKKLTK